MQQTIVDETEQILGILDEGVYFVDTDRRITFWNKAAERITGFAAADVVGTCCKDNILMHVDASGNRLCLAECPVSFTLNDGEHRRAEVFLHHKLGHRVPVQVQVLPQRADDGRIVGALEVFRDISSEDELREELERLRRIALIDGLTGLANRRHIDEHLAARASQLDRFGWT